MKHFTSLLLAGVSLALVACNDQSAQSGSTGPAAPAPSANVLPEEIVNADLRDYVDQFPKSDTQIAAVMSFGARLAGSVPLAENEMATNYYFVLDGSGSMSESNCTESQTKMAVAKDALTELFAMIPPEDNVGLFVFDEAGVSERVALGNGNRTELNKAVAAVVPDYRTPLGASVHQGAVVLEQQAAAQFGYGEYNLVVVTDGEASDGSDLKQIVDLVAERTPINLYTVGFCIDERHVLNQEGRTEYRSALNTEELGTALRAVLAESEEFGDVQEFN